MLFTTTFYYKRLYSSGMLKNLTVCFHASCIQPCIRKIIQKRFDGTFTHKINSHNLCYSYIRHKPELF